MDNFVHEFPQSNLHEQNLDWVISKVKELTHIIDDFTALQSIKWADEWSIDKQYPAWAIVSNGADGYISIKPVPAGVLVTNTSYWAKIANYDVLYAAFEERIEALESDVEILKAHMIEWVNVKDFGAVGDGITDDSDAFQAAFDTGRNVYVPLTHGERYLITKTINATAKRQSMFGDMYNHNWASPSTPAADNQTGYIVVDFTSSDANTPAFYFKNNNSCVSFISIVNPNSDSNVQYGTAFKFDTIDVSDGIELNGACTFNTIRGFKIGCDAYGRSFKCCDNHFYGNHTDIHYYIRVGDDWEDNPTASNVYQQYPEYVGRALIVSRNRHHVNRLYVIHVESDTIEYDGNMLRGTLQGAQIIDNNIDSGYGYYRFDCNMYNCIFSRNVMLATTAAYMFRCSYEMNGCIISDNELNGAINELNVNRYPTYAIFINKMKKCVIKGNHISNTGNAMITCDSSGAEYENINITDNIFDNWGIDATSSLTGTCIALPTCTNFRIASNTFIMSANSRYGVRERNTSAVWTDGKVIDNILPYGETLNVLATTYTRVTVENNVA